MHLGQDNCSLLDCGPNHLNTNLKYKGQAQTLKYNCSHSDGEVYLQGMLLLHILLYLLCLIMSVVKQLDDLQRDITKRPNL